MEREKLIYQCEYCGEEFWSYYKLYRDERCCESKECSQYQMDDYRQREQDARYAAEDDNYSRYK